MRGRDYGLPAYVYYLDYLRGVQIKSWNDLKAFIPEKRLNKLKSIYKLAFNLTMLTHQTRLYYD